MSEVRLTGREQMTAATSGAMRHIRAIQSGRADAYGFDGDGWEAHIEGCAAEMAVGKLLNVYPSGLGQPYATDDDVGGIQVRRRAEDWHELYVWESDPDDAPFVLVTGKMPSFKVVGWILGGDAKQPNFWKEPGGGAFPRHAAFFVNQQHLHPMAELRDAVATR